MLSKCANPTCSNEFHYFGEGKVFEIRADKGTPRRAESTISKRKHVEHFWLCSDCCSELTIGMDSERNVIVIPRPPKKVQQAAAS